VNANADIVNAIRSSNLDVVRALRELVDVSKKKKHGKPTASQATPLTTDPVALSAIAAAGSSAGTEITLGGYVLRMSSSASHASAKLEVCFDRVPTRGSNWLPIAPGGKARPPHGGAFESFRLRKQTGTPSTSNTVRFIVDTSDDGSSFEENNTTAQVSTSGKLQVECGFQNAAGSDVIGIASNEGALAASGWDGTNYTRMSVSSNGSLVVAGRSPVGGGIVDNPVQVGGVDGGSLMRAFLTDTSGRQVVVGAGASGVAAAGNPVLVAGKDYGSGFAKEIPVSVAGNAAGTYVPVAGADHLGTARALPVELQGQPTPNAALVVGGNDGTNVQWLKVDTSGRPIVVGAAAEAAAVVGNPVLVAGYFAGNVETLRCVASNAAITVGGLPADARLAVQSQSAQSTTTIWNNVATGAAGKSTTFTAWGLRRIEFIGHVSAATTLSVEFSSDGATWYVATVGTALGQTPNVALAGASDFSLAVETGAPYVRLSSLNNVTATAVACGKA
jgi:hypothetical protein